MTSDSRPVFPQMDAVIPLNKPVGPTSAFCLNAFKRQGQRKIGHAGTLDPQASGILLVLLGQATKLSSWLLENGRKVYYGQLRLGVETDTWDTQGQIAAEKPFCHITPQMAQEAILDWPNIAVQQVPPYSAAKHNGQPLYKLARKGHDTPIKLKSVKIFEAGALDISLPYVTFRVHCASGVYIRSLAHSLGKRLGCGAALSQLTREYSHPFGLDAACSWEEAQNGHWPAYAKTLAEALPDWQVVDLDHAWARKTRNGIAPPADGPGDRAILCHEGTPLALASRDGGRWIVKRGLWNP